MSSLDVGKGEVEATVNHVRPLGTGWACVLLGQEGGACVVLGQEGGACVFLGQEGGACIPLGQEGHSTQGLPQ